MGTTLFILIVTNKFSNVVTCIDKIYSQNKHVLYNSPLQVLWINTSTIIYDLLERQCQVIYVTSCTRLSS